MESYRTMNNGYIQRQSDLALIPCNEGNNDYLQYLEDVKNGADNTSFDYEAEEIRQQTAEIESVKQKQKIEIITKLDELDKKAIRPLLDNETDRVEEIKTQKNLLREQLNSL